jgi:uncharacterized protein YpuA (DUF1002 family)
MKSRKSFVSRIQAIINHKSAALLKIKSITKLTDNNQKDTRVLVNNSEMMGSNLKVSSSFGIRNSAVRITDTLSKPNIDLNQVQETLNQYNDKKYKSKDYLKPLLNNLKQSNASQRQSTEECYKNNNNHSRNRLNVCYLII